MVYVRNISSNFSKLTIQLHTKQRLICEQIYYSNQVIVPSHQFMNGRAYGSAWGNNIKKIFLSSYKYHTNSHIHITGER